MRILACLLLALVPLAAQEKGFKQLFNGKDFTGWKVNENQQTFSIREGAIVANGPRSHCFYVGDFKKHEFKNFELKVDVKTMANSNGGIYIMTEYQDQGFPSAGFEVQVNNTFVKDPRKTGSLYAVLDFKEQIAQDNEWFTEHIIVKDGVIKILVNGKETVTWKQPADWNGTKESPKRLIRGGTIALQGHDPGSTVYYKNIRIKPLK